MSVLETSSATLADRPRSSLLDRALGIAERGDAMIALGFIWLVLLSIQNSTANVIGIDGYYHIKLAWLMRQEGLKVDFPWLPLTVLNARDFTDHHLLYHILLVPFTFMDLRAGAKIAGLVFSVLALFSTYWVMARLRVRFPLFWLLVLVGSAEWFLAREAMTRRQSVSLTALLLATYLLASGRFRLLAPLAFAYAWLFDGFVLLIAVAAIGFLARLLADRAWHWPIFGWALLGLALALLLNPYFPNNVTFTYLHLLPKIAPTGDVTVGNEWYPYSWDVLLATSALAVLLVPLGLLPAVYDPRRLLRDRTALLLGGMAVMFLVLYLRSRRFVETEPAFAALFCAYTLTHHWPPPLAAGWARLPRLGRLVGIVALLAGLGVQTWHTVAEAQADVVDNHDYRTFQAAATWLEQNTEPGERVYHTDWDDFPELFFFNTYNTYMVGLDPTYMYLANPDLYRLWRSIGRGQVAQPAAAIRDRLGARWMITDREHADFLQKAAADPDLELVFQTPGALVYHIKG